jgi:hypothetical protein
MVGMAMARAAWGFDTESLQGGAGARVPAGWRSSTGGRGRRLVEEQRKKEGFWQGVDLGLLSSLESKLQTTKRRDLQISGLQKEIPSRSFPSLSRFAGKKKKEREKDMG